MADGNYRVEVKVVPNAASLARANKKIQEQFQRNPVKLRLDTRSVGRPLGKITGDVNEFNKSLAASNARVLAFAASAGVVLQIKRAFEGLVKSTIEVEKSLKDINVILNASDKNLQKFGSDLFRIANQTAQSFKNVSIAATEFSRQGLGVQETLQRTRDALILTRQSGLDVEASVSALTATINSFNKTALNSTAIVNKLANVDAAFAVSSKDLADAISRVGASAQDANVSFNELIALVTSAQQVTARGGAVLGNSFKTIFQRLQRPDTLKRLRGALGADKVDDVGGSDLLKNIAKGFGGLDKELQTTVVQLSAGVFQANVFRAILGDLAKENGIYAQSLEVVNNTTDEAVKRNEELNKSLSALLQQTRNNLTQFGANVGQETVGPILKSGLGAVGTAVGGINKQLESEGGNASKGILKGIGGIASFPGAAIVGAAGIKFISGFAKFSKDALGSLTKNTQQVAVQKRIFTEIQSIQSRSNTILKSEGQLEKIITQELIKQTNEMQRQQGLATNIAKSITNKGIAFTAGAQGGLVQNNAFGKASGKAAPTRTFGQRARGALGSTGTQVGAAIAAPLLGGLAQQGLGENTKAGIAAGGVGNVVGGIAAGGLIGGPAGALVGVITGIGAVISTMTQLSKITPKLSKNLEKLQEKFTRQSESLQIIISTVERVKKFDPKDTEGIAEARRTIEENISALPSGNVKSRVREAFKGKGKDLSASLIDISSNAAQVSGGEVRAAQAERKISNILQLKGLTQTTQTGGLSGPDFGSTGSSQTFVTPKGVESARLIAQILATVPASERGGIAQIITDSKYSSLFKNIATRGVGGGLPSGGGGGGGGALSQVVGSDRIAAVSARSAQFKSERILQRTFGASLTAGQSNLPGLIASQNESSSANRNKLKLIQATQGRSQAATASLGFDGQSARNQGASGRLKSLDTTRKGLASRFTALAQSFEKSLETPQRGQGGDNILNDNLGFLSSINRSKNPQGVLGQLRSAKGVAQNRISALEGNLPSEGSLESKELTLLRGQLKQLKTSINQLESGIDTANITEKSAIQIARENNATERQLIETLKVFNTTRAVDALAISAGQTSGQADFLQGRFNANSAGGQELSAAKSAARLARRKNDGVDPKRDLAGAGKAFTERFQYNQFDFFNQIEDGAKSAADTMKSEFNSAFKSFIDGSQGASQAFRSFGIGVLEKISDVTTGIATNALFSSLFNKAGISGKLGEAFQKFSSGGEVRGGSGTKDDVPALLQGGEYVLSKQAVQNVGRGNLEALNNNKQAADLILANRFAVSGGSGSFDVSSNLSSRGQTSEINRQNSVKFRTEQDFYGYLSNKKAFEERQDSATNQFKRAKRQRLYGNLLSAGISAGFGAFSGNGSPAGTTVSNGQSHAPGSLSNSFFNAQRRNQGGKIFGPSSPVDNVPALLTGGEFVMNKETVDRLGAGFFEGLNSSRGAKSAQRFNTGGLVNSVDPFNGADDTGGSQVVELLTRIADDNKSLKEMTESSQKLSVDEVSSSSENNFSVSIEINNNGQVSSNTQGSNQTQDPQKAENSKALGEKVKNVVIETIIEEQGPGGLLSKF